MKFHKTFIIIISLLVVSCTNQYNAEEAAEEYCKCMKDNGASKSEQFIYATKLCDATLIKKYHYYKIFNVDMANKFLQDKLSPITIDSTHIFINKFDQQIRAKCCRLVLL